MKKLAISEIFAVVLFTMVELKDVRCQISNNNTVAGHKQLMVNER